MFIYENEKLMAEWHWDKNNEIGLDPRKLTAGSNKKAWWICEKGHEWENTIEKRIKKKTGCPYCSNRKVLNGYNDLKTLYPAVALDWDYNKNTDIDIDTINVISIKRVWWKCAECGNEWNTPVRDRTVHSHKCPKCIKKVATEKRIKTYIHKNGALDNELLLKEWNYEKNGNLKPEMFTKSSNKKVWWKCSTCNYEWFIGINHRTNKGSGCPKCAGQVLIKGENDLETLNPDLAKEWNYDKNGELKPSDIRLNYNKKVWWKCPQGHEYQATPNHRNSGTNCPVCNSGRQTSFAEQAVFYYVKQAYPDAINRYAEIFDNRMEVDIFIPSIKTAIEYDGVYWHNRKEISKTREKIKYEKCKENNIKLIRIREEVSDNEFEIADICYHIDNIDYHKNLNYLIRFFMDHIDPRSNMWTRKDPRMIHSPVDIDVDRDRFEIMKYLQVVKDNSLCITHPEIAADWNYEKNRGLTPDMFTAGSGKKLWWKCKICGFEWQTTVSRRTRGTKCPDCVLKNSRENHYLAKKIYQYTLDGKFMKEWPSISGAARDNNIGATSIRRALYGEKESAGGYKWSFDENL